MVLPRKSLGFRFLLDDSGTHYHAGRCYPCVENCNLACVQVVGSLGALDLVAATSRGVKQLG